MTITTAVVVITLFAFIGIGAIYNAAERRIMSTEGFWALTVFIYLSFLVVTIFCATHVGGTV